MLDVRGAFRGAHPVRYEITFAGPTGISEWDLLKDLTDSLKDVKWSCWVVVFFPALFAHLLMLPLAKVAVFPCCSFLCVGFLRQEIGHRMCGLFHGCTAG